MGNGVEDFGKTATSLARNPLGIIALFIVLVYGLASVVVINASAFSPQERIPLVYFLVLFPVLVLGVFGWLVSRHPGSLFAPSDFKNEENYVKMQMSAVASLSAAVAKGGANATEADLQGVVSVVRAAGHAQAQNREVWKNSILWVDDRPENNVYERQAFEAMGLRFSLALSTTEAISILSATKFAAIISDMGRKEGPREGYALLDQLREQGDETPLFFYASSNSKEHKKETEEHGGQGCTNNAQELFEMVTKAVIQRLAG